MVFRLWCQPDLMLTLSEVNSFSVQKSTQFRLQYSTRDCKESGLMFFVPLAVDAARANLQPEAVPEVPVKEGTDQSRRASIIIQLGRSFILRVLRPFKFSLQRFDSWMDENLLVWGFLGADKRRGGSHWSWFRAFLAPCIKDTQASSEFHSDERGRGSFLPG